MSAAQRQQDLGDAHTWDQPRFTFDAWVDAQPLDDGYEPISWDVPADAVEHLIALAEADRLAFLTGDHS